MILTNLVSLSAEDDERAKIDAERIAMREGGAAFAMGKPITACPPFKHPDHAWAWRQGWRNEACAGGNGARAAR